MSYQDYLEISDMVWLNLFDDIPYKYIKDLLQVEDEMEVDIQDIHGHTPNKCTTQFTFVLKINVSGGSLPIWNDRTFTVVKEYDSSSAYAMYMGNLWIHEEDLEDEDIELFCDHTP